MVRRLWLGDYGWEILSKTLSDITELDNGMAPKGLGDTKKLINIYGIASLMKYWHHQSIVHRDLKFQNILMDSSLFPKMTKISENSSSLNHQSLSQMKGTLHYIAPGIHSGDPCSK